MPKTAIASLFSQLKYFRPSDAKPWDGKFLVNQNDDAPDRDALLHKIGEASMEIMDYIKDHDELKKKADTWYTGLDVIDKGINAVVASPSDTDLLIKFDNLMSRYRVMCDFINILANNTPNEKLRPAIERFMKYKGKQILDEYAQKTATIPLPVDNAKPREGDAREYISDDRPVQLAKPNGQNGVGSSLPQAGDGF